jgi:plastocyanin
MRGIGGHSAALLVIALVVLSAGAFLYSSSLSGRAEAKTPPEVITSVTSPTTSTQTVPMSVLAAGRPGTVLVMIFDDSGENDDGATQFDPRAVTVVLGLNSTVTWVNQDSIAHSVLTTSGFSSGDIAPGQSYSYTFTKAGTYSYSCGYYPIMTGIITVKNA